MFLVEVHTDTAPDTAAYVLALIDRVAYDGSSFYRSTTLGLDRKPLIQGGPWADVMCGITGVVPDIDMLEHFETTRTSGATHVAGAVSLARDLFRTGYGLPEWFIRLDEYPDLDHGGRTEPDDRGFPVFGTVTAGLDIDEAIAAKPTGAPTRPLAGSRPVTRRRSRRRSPGPRASPGNGMLEIVDDGERIAFDRPTTTLIFAGCALVALAIGAVVTARTDP